MACTHIAGCPLFPYLNASLAGWRETYCDSTTEWRHCARFQLSSEGRPVPVALLPNGKLPVALIPDLSRAESLGLATSLGGPGCGAGPGPDLRAPVPQVAAAAPQVVGARMAAAPAPAPAVHASTLTEDLFRPARPQPPRPPLTDYLLATSRARLPRPGRWARILQWLRTPA